LKNREKACYLAFANPYDHNLFDKEYRSLLKIVVELKILIIVTLLILFKNYSLLEMQILNIQQ